MKRNNKQLTALNNGIRVAREITRPREAAERNRGESTVVPSGCLDESMKRERTMSPVVVVLGKLP